MCILIFYQISFIISIIQALKVGRNYIFRRHCRWSKINNRRSYLVLIHLVSTHIVTTHCQLLLQFTLNLLEIETGFIYIYFYQRVWISGKYRRNYQDQTNSLWVIRRQMLGQNLLLLNVLGLNRCAWFFHNIFLMSALV